MRKRPVRARVRNVYEEKALAIVALPDVTAALFALFPMNLSNSETLHSALLHLTGLLSNFQFDIWWIRAEGSIGIFINVWD